ncbi:MAG: DUF5991 domain-containing protein [Pyrinomonadaceae bacterium]
MKFLSKIGIFCLLFLAFCASVYAQNEWAGTYEFNEDGGMTAGGTAIFIHHQMQIKETDDGLVAFIHSDGYQTSKDLVCTAKIEGAKLLIYFESYGENNMFESFEEGDLLLTLEKQTVKGKTSILTHWNKFQPIVPKNEKSGVIYFKKFEKLREN